MGTQLQRYNISTELTIWCIAVFSDEIYLLCKGAESAMLDRAVDGDTITTLQHINEYAMVKNYQTPRKFIYIDFL